MIAAGATHSSYRSFARSFGGHGGAASLIGTGDVAPVELAAQMHGGATTVLQWQDGHRVSRGHPASHLTPALLAVAEAENRSAAAVMGAFVAGYEVAVRIGTALGGLHPLLHDAGTFATLGTAVAVAHLRSDGDCDLIAEALEAAAAICPMPWRDTVMAGASVHHLYIGEGARVALIAVRAAEQCLHALGGAVESFFGPRAGAAFDRTALIDGIGDDGRWSRYGILDSYIKWWPACAHLSTLADAAAALVAEHGLLEDRIVDVEAAIYGYALEYNAPSPNTDLAARFSIAAVVATVLATGTLGLDDFGEAQLRSDTFLARAKRVRVIHDRAFDALYPEFRPCRLRVSLTDGRVLVAERRTAYGDAAAPLTAIDRNAKVGRLLAWAYGEEGGDAIAQALTRYLRGGRIAELSAALRRPAVNGPTGA